MRGRCCYSAPHRRGWDIGAMRGRRPCGKIAWISRASPQAAQRSGSRLDVDPSCDPFRITLLKRSCGIRPIVRRWIWASERHYLHHWRLRLDGVRFLCIQLARWCSVTGSSHGSFPAGSPCLIHRYLRHRQFQASGMGSAASAPAARSVDLQRTHRRVAGRCNKLVVSPLS